MDILFNGLRERARCFWHYVSYNMEYGGRGADSISVEKWSLIKKDMGFTLSPIRMPLLLGISR